MSKETLEDNPVKPVAEIEPEEVEKDVETSKYDEVKHNRLMMEFDAHDIDENSKKSVKEKKKTTLLFIILIICLGIIIPLIYFYINNDKYGYDYKESTTASLNEIYTSGNDDKLKELLERINGDQDKIAYVNEKTNETINEWVNYLSSKKFNNLNEFNTGVISTKTSIDKVHNTKIDDLCALSEPDYNSIKTKLDKIDQEGNEYYTIVDKYNNKEYNEAYELFSNINKEKIFYEKSQEYLTIIVDEVLDNIQKEVDQMQIITYEDKDAIVMKIESYAYTYKPLNLSNNEKYQNMLKAYRE